MCHTESCRPVNSIKSMCNSNWMMPMTRPHHAGEPECENVSPLGRDFNLTTHPCIYFNYVVPFSGLLSLLFPNARIWHHLQQVPTSFAVVISSKHMFMYLVVWYWINYFILLSPKVLIQKVTFTYILRLMSPHTDWKCVFSVLPIPTKQESVSNNTPVKSPHTKMMLGTEETIEDY